MSHGDCGHTHGLTKNKEDEMAFTINKVVQVGCNLTKDVEVRYTNDGKAVSSFGIAMNRYAGKNPDGSYKEAVDFFNVEAWDLPEGLVQRLVKGQKIALEGEMRQKRWPDKNGQEQQRVVIIAKNIILIGAPKEGQAERAPAPNKPVQHQSTMDTSPLSDDDVPWDDNF
jgi:single-strand DNA-binding protein